MNSSDRKTIFRRLSAKGYSPRHVAEVGVFHPESSNVYDYVVQGVRCTLVEPDPGSIERIRKRFGEMGHVVLHPVAVHDRPGTVQLTQRSASSFLSELKQSPAMANDGVDPTKEPHLTVDAVTFDSLDDGSIDLLSVDIEGAEWYVLKHLVSRPDVISVETHGGAYVNPRLSEILAWMTVNRYVAWYKDRSDTVFVRRGVFAPSWLERLRLAWMTWVLGVRRARKRLVRAVFA